MTPYEIELLIARLADTIADRVAMRIEERISVRLGRAMPLDPVYTVEQSMEYVGAKSDSAFYRWKQLRGLQSCGFGYRKSALDKALDISAIVIAARRGRRKATR